MRENLFRGKTSWGEWICGSYLKTDDNKNNPLRRSPLITNHQITTYFSNDWNLGGWSSIDVIPETVSQFTGLLDKNKKKIFEDDIFHYTKHDGYILESFDAIVIYDDKFASYGYHKIPKSGKYEEQPIHHFTEHDELDMDVLPYIEVIGNIHSDIKLFRIKQEITTKNK